MDPIQLRPGWRIAYTHGRAETTWTDLTVRYVVPVRTRRHWSSTLILALSEETAKPEHAGRILPVYPRTEITLRREWPAAGET